MSDKPARPVARGRRRGALPASPETDALYGLEPVIEVGEGAGSDLLEGFVTLSCPYCAEVYGVAVDLSAGSQSYIEDCQICCQPINLQLTVTDSGEFAGLNAERIDR